MTTRYLICGGRDFTDWLLMLKTLNAIILHPKDAVIIHGGAKGADRLADRWGAENGAQVQAVPADWKGLGVAAGPIRNTLMLTEYKPDVVIAFPGGKGTADMVRKATAAKLVTIQVTA